MPAQMHVLPMIALKGEERVCQKSEAEWSGVERSGWQNVNVGREEGMRYTRVLTSFPMRNEKSNVNICVMEFVMGTTKDSGVDDRRR